MAISQADAQIIEDRNIKLDTVSKISKCTLLEKSVKAITVEVMRNTIKFKDTITGKTLIIENKFIDFIDNNSNFESDKKLYDNEIFNFVDYKVNADITNSEKLISILLNVLSDSLTTIDNPIFYLTTIDSFNFLLYKRKESNTTFLIRIFNNQVCKREVEYKDANFLELVEHNLLFSKTERKNIYKKIHRDYFLEKYRLKKRRNKYIHLWLNPLYNEQLYIINFNSVYEINGIGRDYSSLYKNYIDRNEMLLFNLIMQIVKENRID